MYEKMPGFTASMYDIVKNEVIPDRISVFQLCFMWSKPNVLVISLLPMFDIIVLLICYLTNIHKIFDFSTCYAVITCHLFNRSVSLHSILNCRAVL